MPQFNIRRVDYHADFAWTKWPLADLHSGVQESADDRVVLRLEQMPAYDCLLDAVDGAG